MNTFHKFASLALISSVIVGCSSSPTENETETTPPISQSDRYQEERYELKHDVAPDQPISVEHIEEITPQYEPYSLGGNKNYTVRGQRYQVIKDPTGFKQTGQASWYGKKFHGHLTSNGEVYDMYSMTAAHKELPLPSYVKVTNTDNGKSTIVRVNDRGPFHPGRIIDLSYAAASKLGMLAKGTARVEVEAINPRAWQSASRAIAAPPSSDVSAARAVPTALTSGRFIQVGAYSQAGSANRVARQLSDLYGRPTKVADVERTGQTLYRVLVGPFASVNEMERMIYQLGQSGYPGAHPVDFP